MKYTLQILLTTLFILVSVGQSHAGPMYTELVVFGDSLSDSGNVFQRTTDNPALAQDPPSPPYFDGRATNGLNWIDRIADLMNIPRPTAYLRDLSGTNYAFAGAATGGGTSTRFPSPTLPSNAPYEVDNVGTQIASFLANNQFQQGQLVTLWAGAGDLARVRGIDDIVKIVDNLEGHIRTLNNNGAKTVLVPNQLDSGFAPFFDLPGTPDPLVISNAVNILNNILGNRLMLLSEDPTLDINIISADITPLFQLLLSGNSGFINVDNAWLLDARDGVAESADPNDYFFYDVIHPTARAHNFIANTLFSDFAAVPTPPTVFLLIVGALVFRIQRSKA